MECALHRLDVMAEEYGVQPGHPEGPRRGGHFGPIRLGSGHQFHHHYSRDRPDITGRDRKGPAHQGCSLPRRWCAGRYLLGSSLGLKDSDQY